ncbi:MAG: 3'-5' exonuclease, partial [Planctomycetota bacterium]
SRFHVSHSPLADLLNIEPETQETQSANRDSVIEGAAKLRDRLVQSGYGPTIESLARFLAPNCTKRELIRLQHLVRLAYASRSDSQRWSMRPSRFVDYIRDEVKIADASSARIRVMTIHKSKGLEFDSVVLPQPYQTNGWIGMVPPLIVGRQSPTEPIETVCRYANANHRKLLPTSIQEVFEDDQERSVRESMCVLYVAMTRAVHSLHIVMSYSHKPNQKSSSGVLLALLCPEVGEKGNRKAGLIFERGNESWFKLDGANESQPNPEIDKAKIEQYYLQNLTDNFYRPLSRNAKSMRGLSRVRPSHLDGGNLVRLSDTLTSPGRERTQEFGRLIHACFEQVRWLDEGEQVSDQQLKKFLQNRSPGSDQIDTAIGRFRELIQIPNLEKLLSANTVKEQHVIADLDSNHSSTAANRIEVHVEKRMAVLMSQFGGKSSEANAPTSSKTMVEGIVDRLVLVFENGKAVAAEIVDFKSDQIDDTNLTDRIQHYRPQLETYQLAVEEALGIPANRISTRLVFVHSGHVIQLDCPDHSVDGKTELKLPRKLIKKQPSTAKGPAKPKPPKGPKIRGKKPTTEVQGTFWSDDPED